MHNHGFTLKVYNETAVYRTHNGIDLKSKFTDKLLDGFMLEDFRNGQYIEHDCHNCMNCHMYGNCMNCHMYGKCMNCHMYGKCMNCHMYGKCMNCHTVTA